MFWVVFAVIVGFAPAWIMNVDDEDIENFVDGVDRLYKDLTYKGKHVMAKHS